MSKVPYLACARSLITICLVAARGQGYQEGKGHVILRVMRGRGDRHRIASLDDALRAELRTGDTDRRGPERFHLGWRSISAAAAGGSAAPEGGREVVIVSHWASAEDAARADEAKTSPLAIASRHLGSMQAVHFEVDDTIRRDSRDEPVAIRLATGRFSKPGADAEMQNLLRQRAPLIGEEMAEAWVGRRLTGRAVEVTFVSTWRRLPADRPLDEAFWPDIALRYDQFVVEVYSAVGVE
jgi:hypothetical protein